LLARFVRVRDAARAARRPDRVGGQGAFRTSVLAVVVVVTLVSLAGALRDVVRPSAGQRAERAIASLTAQAVRAHSRPGDRVLFIDTSVFPTYPVLVETARWPGSRYLWSFPIALFAHHPDPAAEARMLRELVSDVHHQRPQLILVKQGACQGCPPGFSLTTYLRAHGLLARLTDYTPVRAVGWLGFERRPSTAAADAAS
jgi:hypothetical protein